MATVTVKISPSLAGALNASGSDWLIFKREISDSATIGEVFTDIAAVNPEFRTVIYDPDTGKINDLVTVVLNNSLMKFPDVKASRLCGGDTVILLPVYMGG